MYFDFLIYIYAGIYIPNQSLVKKEFSIILNNEIFLLNHCTNYSYICWNQLQTHFLLSVQLYFTK